MTSETRHVEAAGRPWSRGGLGRAATAETSAVSLLDTLSEVVFRTDTDGRWTYLNRAWTTLTGYEVGPSLGARFLDYVHPDEVEYAATVFADMARAGTDQCVHEARCRTRHGGYLRVQIRASVLRGPAGEVVGNSGTIVDVSGSRSHAQVVGEQSALLESVGTGSAFEDLPTGVAVYDRELRVRRSSSAVDRMVGAALRVGEPLDRLVERVRPADWRSRSLGGEWGLVPVALRTGRSQLGDLELDVEGGSARSVRATVIPFQQGGEELAALVLSDITDLRRAERQQAGLARLGQRALAGVDLPTLLTEAVELVAGALEVAVCEVIQRDVDGRELDHELDGELDGGPGPGPDRDPAGRRDAAPTDPGVFLTDPAAATAALTDPAAPTAPTALGVGPIYLTGPLAIEARSLVHLAFDVDEPVVANNLDACPHLRSGWSDAGGAQAALASRVGSAGSPYGVLAVASLLPRRFTGDEARFVQAVANTLGAAIDRERSERRARARYEAAQRGRAWLAASAEITAGAMVASQSQQARMLLASLARAVTSADVGAVALPDEAGNLVATEVDSAGHRHSDPETLHSLALALEAAESRSEFLAGRPVLVDGLDDSDAWSGPIALAPLAEAVAASSDLAASSDPSLEPGSERDAGSVHGGVDGAGDLLVAVPVPPIPPGPRLRDALVVPLTAAGEQLGALVLGNAPDGVPFAADDPELVGVFANDAAMAIQLAEAQRERARFAVFEDRERIARDLHDLVIQRLFAIGLHLQSLTRAVGDVTAARLNAAINGLDSSIEDIRRTIFRLQPTPVGA
ncbi:histidine kinase [Frankia sp. R43]|uniref:PAS domain-containing protein n=1 Tax=Frankia sp. R43 TaxID=269536 RepID=UPI0006C9FDE0|nr:PAS domain-containing protein [Frankia sp. R43]KPM51665.1 histidine kinase [Frankia sp. R43]